MQAEHTDRRVRRTRAQLAAALTTLLAQQELKDISVSELTRLADVNRGTFYLHYRDTYDLFAQLEGELFDSFLSIIERYRNNSPVPWRGVMRELLLYVAEHGPSFAAVLRVKESTLLERIIEQVKPTTPEEWRKLFGGGSAQDYEYCYTFMTSGFIALVGNWFLGGMKEPVEDLAALAERLMSACTDEFTGKA